MAFEPLAGNRFVFVRERRTAKEFAQGVRDLVMEKYAGANKVVLVLDNLNTHGVHSLYEAFEPSLAEQINERIEWHCTPKHGSWLMTKPVLSDMAEIELSVLARRCLAERMQSKEHLTRQVLAWQERRNASKARGDWQFAVEDARNKLKQLYLRTLTS